MAKIVENKTNSISCWFAITRGFKTRSLLYFVSMIIMATTEDLSSAAVTSLQLLCRAELRLYHLQVGNTTDVFLLVF